MGKGWAEFDLSDEKELKARGIKIGYGAIIGDLAKIGYGAEILNTIFITGSRNSLNYYGEDLYIGCIKMPVNKWLEKYEEIGMKEGYTPEQIKEYKKYIDMIAMIHENNTDA